MRQAIFAVVNRLAGRLGWWAVQLVIRIPGRPAAEANCAGCGKHGTWTADQVGAWCPSCGGGSR
jgi:hypothetical protein